MNLSPYSLPYSLLKPGDLGVLSGRELPVITQECKMRLIGTFIVILAVMFVLMESPRELRAQELLEGIVAVVGNTPLTYSEIEERVALMVLQGIIPESEADNQRLRRDIVNEMLKEKLLVVSAERAGIEVFQDELNRMVEDQVETVTASFPSRAVFEQELARQNMSLPELKEQYRKVLREKILQEKVLDREVRSRVNVAEREIRNYFEHFREELPAAEMKYSYKCLHVPVSPDSSRKAKAVADLNNLKEKIESGEMNFADAATDFSEDPGSAGRGGSLGKVNFGTLMSRFEDTVKSIEKGEVSDVFETRLGCHLVMVDDKNEEWFKARHILKKLSMEEKDWSSAEDHATEIRDRIIKGEISFEEAVSVFPAGAENYTDGLPVDNIPSNILTVLKNAGAEAVPSIIKTGEEFIVVLPGLRTGGGRMDYNQARSYITQKLRGEKMESRLERFLTQEKERTYIKLNEYYGIGNKF